ncbi:MAG: hypothetical protein A2Y10_15940 [Planctomycetes bacterium GWF2_41_51]|nr:MAG: hypothetical protein A2Y10_15940 [Planctomycetes bacterium GWF2_41_51]
MKKILFIGFGNPSRGDDGLGPAIAERLENENFPGVTVDADYQLTVEDSENAAKHDIVIFADASVNCDEPFSFKPLAARQSESFTSHSVEPAEVIGLAEKLFNSKAKPFMLEIRGYNFEMFEEDLTEKAKKNLEKAWDFLKELLKKQNFNIVACA